MNQFNWDQAFTLDFDLNNGLSKHADTTKRYLSQMKNMYQDQEAVEEILKHEDPLIYEFYELGCPERAGDLAFGTTMIHPGKIGNEYYMTKGHFHQIVDTAEVYYTLKGEGYMMLENLDGDWRVERMEKGKALYVPRGYAHRTINTGDEVLTAFYVFDADAGHDYGTIETKGYRRKEITEKKVGVVEGTSSAQYAEDYLSEDNKITYYKNITKVWNDLEKGTIDATIYDTTGIQNYMQEHADNTNLSVLNEQLNSEESNYGIMFVKGYKYLDQFNVALQVLNNDGTYQKLKEQWIKTKE